MYSAPSAALIWVTCAPLPEYTRFSEYSHGVLGVPATRSLSAHIFIHRSGTSAREYSSTLLRYEYLKYSLSDPIFNGVFIDEPDKFRHLRPI